MHPLHDVIELSGESLHIVVVLGVGSRFGFNHDSSSPLLASDRSRGRARSRGGRTINTVALVDGVDVPSGVLDGGSPQDHGYLRRPELW